MRAILLLGVIGSFMAQDATAGVIIGARQSGWFGEPLSGAEESFAEAWTFSAAGQSVQITATGVVDLAVGFGLIAGPDGIPLVVDGFFVNTTTYTPLEEQDVDNASLVLPRAFGDTLLNVGALIGAFVPQSLADTPGFEARDDDFVVGIPSSSLFLIGSGPFVFTAPEAGKLYLGINESYAANKDGEFDVEITSVNSVPEPTSIALLGTGVLGLCGYGARRRPSKSRTA